MRFLLQVKTLLSLPSVRAFLLLFVLREHQGSQAMGTASLVPCTRQGQKKKGNPALKIYNLRQQMAALGRAGLRTLKSVIGVYARPNGHTALSGSGPDLNSVASLALIYSFCMHTVLYNVSFRLTSQLVSLGLLVNWQILTSSVLRAVAQTIIMPFHACNCCLEFP